MWKKLAAFMVLLILHAMVSSDSFNQESAESVSTSSLQSLFVDAREFPSIQDAINSNPNGGAVFLPCGIYKINSPVLLKPGTRLIGSSKQCVIILQSGSFVGDAVVMASTRDDNNINKLNSVSVEHITIQTVSKNITGIDATGFQNSTFRDIWVNGPGTNRSGSIMLRMSDRNPGGSLRKQTFFNSFENVHGGGSGWKTGIYYESIDGNCNTNRISDFNIFAKTGIVFGRVLGSTVLTLENGYFYGGNIPSGKGIDGTLPPAFYTIGVSFERYTGGTQPTLFSTFLPYSGNLKGKHIPRFNNNGTGLVDGYSVSGNTTVLGTVKGTLPNGHRIKADKFGNLIDGGTE